MINQILDPSLSATLDLITIYHFKDFSIISSLFYFVCIYYLRFSICSPIIWCLNAHFGHWTDPAHKCLNPDDWWSDHDKFCYPLAHTHFIYYLWKL